MERQGMSDTAQVIATILLDEEDLCSGLQAELLKQFFEELFGVPLSSDRQTLARCLPVSDGQSAFAEALKSAQQAAAAKMRKRGVEKKEVVHCERCNCKRRRLK
ncbi:unnamed protein product [Sympodiomycopsis kandeliae]